MALYFQSERNTIVLLYGAVTIITFLKLNALDISLRKYVNYQKNTYLGINYIKKRYNTN